MFCVLYNAMRKEDVIHDGAPDGCTFLVDIVSSFGGSTNPDSGILLCLSEQVKWSQHEQYSKATPFGRSISGDSWCRYDPLLIVLECPVAYKLVLYCVLANTNGFCNGACLTLCLCSL